jgi:hypothetical protein
VVTVSTAAPYIVKIEDHGGFSISNAISAVAALASVLAVVIAVVSTSRSLRAAREASVLAERRALALRVAAWSAAVESAVERHVLSNHDREFIDEPTERDPLWEESFLALDRDHRRLSSEASIILGAGNPMSVPMRDLLHAVDLAGDGLLSWRAAEFVRVHEARQLEPNRTDVDEALEAAFDEEARELRRTRVSVHRMSVATAAIALARALTNVARADWQPTPAT